MAEAELHLAHGGRRGIVLDEDRNRQRPREQPLDRDRAQIE